MSKRNKPKKRVLIEETREGITVSFPKSGPEIEFRSWRPVILNPELSCKLVSEATVNYEGVK